MRGREFGSILNHLFFGIEVIVMFFQVSWIFAFEICSNEILFPIILWLTFSSTLLSTAKNIKRLLTFLWMKGMRTFNQVRVVIWLSTWNNTFTIHTVFRNRGKRFYIFILWYKTNFFNLEKKLIKVNLFIFYY